MGTLDVIGLSAPRLPPSWRAPSLNTSSIAQCMGACYMPKVIAGTTRAAKRAPSPAASMAERSPRLFAVTQPRPMPRLAHACRPSDKVGSRPTTNLMVVVRPSLPVLEFIWQAAGAADLPFSFEIVAWFPPWSRAQVESNPDPCAHQYAIGQSSPRMAGGERPSLPALSEAVKHRPLWFTGSRFASSD